MPDKTKALTRRYVYARMTAEQFSEALNHVEMTTHDFAKIYGTKVDRIQFWLDGKEEVPHNVAVLLGLLTLPGAKDLAWAYTNTVAKDRATGKAIADG